MRDLLVQRAVAFPEPSLLGRVAVAAAVAATVFIPAAVAVAAAVPVPAPAPPLLAALPLSVPVDPVASLGRLRKVSALRQRVPCRPVRISQSAERPGGASPAVRTACPKLRPARAERAPTVL